uniref:Uncharacterized protein n=1 Tax=Candidatus Kentrum sp. FM TaxID=2126340 RepID=A0A450SC21_9GAMM|nr:MAG: hypothetical protein BECKFM1743C_GA0114222_100768 [Candidatus Kentron sp. FM]
MERKELYAKVILHSLTALKMSSKCSFIPYKLRFFIHFRLVMKHNPTFAFTSKVIENHAPGSPRLIREAVRGCAETYHRVCLCHTMKTT